LKKYENFDFADLSQTQIDEINTTQNSLEQNSDDNVILVAYKKVKATEK